VKLAHRRASDVAFRLRSLNRRSMCRFGSSAAEIQCPCHFCFPPHSDQIADIKQRRRRAISGHQPNSFDHLVGAQQDRGWQLHTKGFGGPEIDYQLEPIGLLNRNICDLDPFQNLSNVGRCLPMHGN
jgi:hypothetical protein